MKFAKKSDIFLIIAIFIICVLFFVIFKAVNAKPARYAEIYYKSELVRRIDLTESKDYTFTVDSKPDVVFHVYANGTICFEKSDCPDKVCVNKGILSKTGESAACLPNSLILKIVAKDSGRTDDADIIID